MNSQEGERRQKKAHNTYISKLLFYRNNLIRDCTFYELIKTIVIIVAAEREKKEGIKVKQQDATTTK